MTNLRSRRMRAALRLTTPLCVLALAGCATYRALPLPNHAHLAHGLAELRHVVPGQPPQTIDLGKPLEIGQIGMLAILNDPGLLSERGAMAAAQANLLQASMLPNPVAGLSYAALIGGPGTSTAYTASLSENVGALVTYRARVRSARAQVGAVNAGLLWREWQVAQKARLAALDLYWGRRRMHLFERQIKLLNKVTARVRAANAAGNLGLAALSPLLAAKASAERSLAAAGASQLENWQTLDALLGLVPAVRFAIARPDLPPVPKQMAALIAALPGHRPDLVALRLGYRSSEEKVRAAILGQFPAFALGLTWSSDTTAVRSAGPDVSFDLPIFDRKQGQIAKARASRLMLREQYQARLDAAVAHVHGLLARIRQLSSDLAQAKRAAAQASSLAKTAAAADARANLDLRAATNFETTALDRQTELATLKRGLGEDKIALALELGLGLPTTRLAPLDPTRKP